ncbi:MAG: M24 family metallopeptidase [Spirochaetia bacterium]|nr:M24 family metallopeptidase [Spirochaetia bacterium]
MVRSTTGQSVNGELVRIEATSRYYGYWADAARMMVIGDAEELQKRAYAENLQLKNKAVSMLKPGVKCSTLYNEVADLASAEGIDFQR